MSDIWSISEEEIAANIEYGEYGELLSHLLINEVAFLNSGNPGFFKNDTKGISVNVICSDTFGYACADCETLDHDQIPVLYRMWRRDPLYGAIAWCVSRRKERPINPVVVRMTERGYDLDALMRGELPQ